MITDPYYLRARLFPTILTCIPLLIFVNQVISPLYQSSLLSIYSVLPLLANFGLSASVVFLSVQINRLISKELFQRFFFQDELRMPTTEYLLWRDGYLDKLIKEKLHKKIKERTEIELLSELEENANEGRARKINAVAVSQIRNCLRDNSLILQHNIEYGFFRNLLGGCVLASIFSIAIIIYAVVTNAHGLLVTGLIILLPYFLIICLSKVFIRKYGHYYSKVLFEQFLSV